MTYHTDNYTNQLNNMFTGNINWDLDMPLQEGTLNDHHTQLSFDQLFTENYPMQVSSYSQVPTQSLLSENANKQIPEGQEQKEAKQEQELEEAELLSPMREMAYRIAAMQPVEIDPATIPKPQRRNVRISEEPQSVAARLRREKISEKMRILQRLVPGGTKMDTANMLDEAVRYVKFLKRQIKHLHGNQVQQQPCNTGSSWQVSASIPLGDSAVPTSNSGELSLLQPSGHNLSLEDTITNTFSFNNEVISDN